MSYSDGHLPRPRRPVLPPFSTRTLHHPSFLPLYVVAGFASHHRRDRDSQTVHLITPAELFYTDPAMTPGRRIPNTVTDLCGFDCLQLNTPPPVMSACLAPPTRPDPFKSGPHSSRNLGSPKWRVTPIGPTGQPQQVILQLTYEEDQTITNLLKLHHQVPTWSDRTLVLSPEPMESTSAQEVFKPSCGDVQPAEKAGSGQQLQQGRGWSDMELEAADTLLSRFTLTEEDRLLSHQKSSVTPPDPPPDQHDKDLEISSDTRQESEALPALQTTNSTQNDTSDIRFICVRENRDQGWREFRSAKDRGHFSEVRERTLSDPEGDAVRVLLSLGDTGTLEILQ